MAFRPEQSERVGGNKAEELGCIRDAGKKKCGRQAAVEEIPHSYLLSILTRELWAVKKFLRRKKNSRLQFRHEGAWETPAKTGMAAPNRPARRCLRWQSYACLRCRPKRRAETPEESPQPAALDRKQSYGSRDWRP